MESKNILGRKIRMNCDEHEIVAVAYDSNQSHFVLLVVSPEGKLSQHSTLLLHLEPEGE